MDVRIDPMDRLFVVNLDGDPICEGARIDGRFAVNVNDVPGVVAGEYGVERDAESVRLVFQPLEAWQPPMVRGPSWVSSCRYDAQMDPSVAPARLVSCWKRR